MTIDEQSLTFLLIDLRLRLLVIVTLLLEL